MTTELTNELHEGDPVRIMKGAHAGKIGTVRITGHLYDNGAAICIVEVVDELLYFQDEIERVESEVGNG